MDTGFQGRDFHSDDQKVSNGSQVGAKHLEGNGSPFTHQSADTGKERIASDRTACSPRVIKMS